MDVKITWTDNSINEDGFHVYRSAITDAGEGEDEGSVEMVPIGNTVADLTEFTDVDVLPGLYIYSVSAFNTAGESARTNSNEVLVEAALGVPDAPSNVVAAVILPS